MKESESVSFDEKESPAWSGNEDANSASLIEPPLSQKINNQGKGRNTILQNDTDNVLSIG